MRPVLTGWFAELPAVDGTGSSPVTYEPGAGAFAGATYDPTSHYRAAAVFAFFEDQRLTPDRLRHTNRRQVALLKNAFEALDLDPELARVEAMPEELRGGFLAIRTPHAAAIVPALRQDGIHVDARGDLLRIGPAPYVRDDQLRAGIDGVGRAIRDRAPRRR
jgi:kynureninase